MSTLKRNRSEGLQRNKRLGLINLGLKREVAAQWDTEIPKRARGTIWSSTLAMVSSCLSDDLPPGLDAAVQKAAVTKDLKGVIDLRTLYASPAVHRDARTYFASATVLNLFAKTELPIKGIDTLATGVSRLHEAEKLCAITNRRLRHYRSFDHANRPLPMRHNVHEVFHLARRKIAAWLGSVCESKILDGGRHGPGGVVGLKRPSTTPYFKLANSSISCSTGAYWYTVRYIASCDAWIRALAISEGIAGWECDVSCIPYETKIRLADKCITIVNHNEVTFVNKDALTKRSISIETEFGVYLQLAVGDHFKTCLLSVGCDLSDQGRNQGLAYVGSIQRDHHDPVTMDLRMASDTMAIEIVRELLPREWFEFLDNLRSHRGVYLGKSHEWEKFSSMGNGFTFELETLIFLALAQACSDIAGETEWFADTFGPAYRYAYVSVYGDDIVVPAAVSTHLTAVLRYCGFQLNLQKSFVTGPFRESCGSDFWDGVDVRPFFFKRDLSMVRDLIHLHNGLKSVNEKLENRLTPVLEYIRRMIPTVIETHLRGEQPTTTDGYIWVTPDETHRSSLVVWDINWQRWVLPFCRSSAALGKGITHWKYVQFLYSNTGTRVLDRSDADIFIGSELPRHMSLYDLHFLGGGSRGDVTLSGEGITNVSWW